MTSSDWGWVGGIVGMTLGLAGGIIGTYFSLKNTRTEKERSLMIKFVVGFWAFGLAALSLMLLAAFDVLPQAVYWVVWITFMCLLGPFIVLGNRYLDRAARDEPAQKGPGELPED